MRLRIGALYFTTSALTCTFLYGAEMQPRPQVPVWISDGVAEYRLFVWLDNSGLGGEPTDGAQWGLQSTGPFSYVADSSGPPVIDDFFDDIPMFFEIYQPPTGVCARLVAPIGGGPVDSCGNLGEYRFTVPIGTPSAEYAFLLSLSSKIVDPDGNVQPCALVAGSVRVVESHVEGISTCMNGPDQSYPSSLACDYYDLDGDADVDLADFALFQTVFPEP